MVLRWKQIYDTYLRNIWEKKRYREIKISLRYQKYYLYSNESIKTNISIFKYNISLKLNEY